MRLKTRRAPLIATALLAFGLSAAHAEDKIRTEQVHFEPGPSGATVKGKVKGYDSVDYVLEASKGQRMSVRMNTDNASSYFNILAPGESDAAMFIGSTSGNEYKGALPTSGNYKIRVYLMRSAARRDEVANYTLQMEITGAAEKAGAATPSKDEQACLQAVSTETNNGDVTTLSVEESEANTLVMVGVGPNRAPWKCLAKNGTVAEVMSMTDEGAL